MGYSKIDYNCMLARELIATIEAAIILTKRETKRLKEVISDGTI